MAQPSSPSSPSQRSPAPLRAPIDLDAMTGATMSPSAYELMAVIGSQAVKALCDAVGGRKLNISAGNPEIIAAIGADKARVLSDYCGRTKIYVPRRWTSAQARAARVRELIAAGKTRHATAAAVGLSERQVYNILAQA